MTTPHPFAALVRRLDAEASKAPWEHSIDPVRGPTYEIWAEFANRIGCHIGTPDAAIIVTLRNAAPEVAALVEAVEAYRVANVSIVHHEVAATMGFPDPMHAAVRARDGAVKAMLAALDALAAKAKEV